MKVFCPTCNTLQAPFQGFDYFFCHVCRTYKSPDVMVDVLPHDLEPMPANIEYVGAQQGLDGEIAFYLYNNVIWGATFTVLPGESLNQTLRQKTMEFAVANARSKQAHA